MFTVVVFTRKSPRVVLAAQIFSGRGDLGSFSPLHGDFRSGDQNL